MLPDGSLMPLSTLEWGVIGFVIAVVVILLSIVLVDQRKLYLKRCSARVTIQAQQVFGASRVELSLATWIALGYDRDHIDDHPLTVKVEIRGKECEVRAFLSVLGPDVISKSVLDDLGLDTRNDLRNNVQLTLSNV